MKIRFRKYVYLVILLSFGLFAASTVAAQSGGGYDLSWNTIDSGGGTASGGDYVLMFTVGQSDAGSVLSGGDYTLAGGFWPGGAASSAPEYRIYLPLVVRSYYP